MTDVEVALLQQFSASGSDTRIFYTTIDAVDHIEYIGVSNSVDAPTSMARWFIMRLYYNASGCVTRCVKLSTQQILDDRVSLFP